MSVVVTDASYEAVANSDDLYDWIEVQPQSRLNVAAMRSLRELDMLDDQPEYGTPEWDEFFECYLRNLTIMATGDLLNGMVERGHLTASVNDDGELIYFAVTEPAYS